MARVVVNVPAEAKRGEVIEIRTLAGHPMETGAQARMGARTRGRKFRRKSTCLE